MLTDWCDMRRFILIFLVCVIVAAVRGDSVYMKDGKIYRGKTTRKGDVVRIETSGGTVSVSVDDVLTIVRSETLEGDDEPPEDAPTDDKPPDDAAPRTAPANDEPVGPVDTNVADGGDGSYRMPPSTFSISGARRPEPVVFMLMRQFRSTPAGRETFQLREQIKQWRILAHDRKRKTLNRWLEPEQIVKRREIFFKSLSEAQNLLSESQSTRSDDPHEEAKKQKLRRQGLYKLRKTAQVWPDPLIRKFLMGVANYRSDNHRGAKQLFEECIEEAPYLAGFHQGLAMAQAASERHIEALGKYLDALRLAPTSPQAVNMVRQAMKKVPGRQTSHQVYLRAKEIMKQYSEDSDYGMRYSRGRTYWLLPGGRRGWYDRFPQDEPLPEPPFDRFVFQQAVGVPVSQDVLMADANVLDDALAAFVRIDSTTVAATEVRKSHYSSGSGRSTDELSSVTVRGYTFTPIKIPDEADYPPGTEVRVLTTNLYTRMGSNIHKIPGRVKIKDDEQEKKDEGKDKDKAKIGVTARLLAGESGGVVLTDQGQLVGFLPGKTDVTADDGGKDRFMGLSQISELAKKLASRRGGMSYYSSTRWNPPQRKVEGNAFIIYVVKAEKFGKDER